jgi:hypothetical protein
MQNYCIGIDLGTTNTVLAYVSLTEPVKIQLLAIPQIVAANTFESLLSLASFSYLPNPSEVGDGAFDLPWGESDSAVVGNLARSRSAEAPDRTVGASKSWLCHAGVDRRSPILPWNAPGDVAKISPITAATQYLSHLVRAWDHQFPQTPLRDQHVVLTVPASFDPVARELTREAALAAGLPGDFLLLEEPQAALYAWLEQQGDSWRKQLKVGESVLVCDVGGGTTDLTLINVEEEQGELVLRRVAVGDHLLVGGDNMDLAAAYNVATKFAEKGTKLNPWQTVSLWHSCRSAKERLLSDESVDSHTISVLGRGSKLFGGTVSVEVNRTELSHWLLDGFFPQCELNARPQRQPASGFQEIGLPYESDPAITRHIAAFVSTHCADKESESRLPNHVLFNGGVFKGTGFQDRLLEVMSSWLLPDESNGSVHRLAGVLDLDFAVAKGAAFYGWSKHFGGLRIRGGTASSYYVGIETAGLAIPGMPRPLKALCVVPFGMEEGTERKVPSTEIGLVVGQPVRFRFFSSKVRKDDQPGMLLHEWSDEELVETNPLVATLPREGDETYVPVRFESRITELGVFELWCVGASNPGQWKLEFSVREEE